MKKTFSKILVISMLTSLFSTSVFAAETQDLGFASLSNVSAVSDNYLYVDDNDAPVPLYICEDYTQITINQDLSSMSLYYFYDYDNEVNIGFQTRDANDEFVALFDLDIMMADNTVVTFDDLYAEIDNYGEIGDYDFTDSYYVNGGTIDVLYEGTYIFEVASKDSGLFSYTTFYVSDSDGFDSYVSEDDSTDEVASSEIVTGTAKSATATGIVDGEEIAFEAYEIDGNNYFKLRDLAAVMSGSEKQFEVTWDEELNAIGLISDESYTLVDGELATGDGLNKEYTSTTATIYKDDVQVDFTAYEINDNNYFKLRDVCEAFDIGVTWDDATQTIGIDTSISYVE